MSIPTSLYQRQIVDNPPPVYPDVGRLGSSRIGRKLRRKALDAYHIALRRYEGRPAKSGPPIPNSEKHGRREFFTLQQVHYANKRSQEVRQRKAAPKHREVIRLRRRGLTLAAIGECVGYTAARCCQVLKEHAAEAKRKLLDKASRALNLHYHHQPQPDPAASRSLSLMLVNVHHVLRLLEAQPVQPDRLRYERLCRSYKRRFKGYLAAVYAKQGPLYPILEESWALAESVSGMPVDVAARALNEDFGYRR